jgi:hypothetical protein
MKADLKTDVPSDVGASRATPKSALAQTPGQQTWPRGVAAAALGLALVATGLAGWSLMRPVGTGTAAPSSQQQIGDAKTQACRAMSTVGSAVSLQTHADLGADPVAVQAVAANARLSMAAGGTYLLAHLDSATSQPLAGAIRSFAVNLQEIAMNTMAGLPNDDPAQAVRLGDAQKSSAHIADLCKSD